MKNLKLIILFIAISAPAYAQEAVDATQAIRKAAATAAEEKEEEEKSKWTKQGLFGVNMAQSSFRDWVAGGEAAIALDAMFSYSLNYRHEKNLWSNRFETAYGFNNTRTNGMIKTNDRIFLSSIYGYSIAPKLFLGSMLTFSTQFDKGYNYVALNQRGEKPNNTNYISKFMAPGYLTIGAGVIWVPYTWLQIMYNPASWRGTFVFDDNLPEGQRYGVDVGKTLFSQFGSNLVTEVVKELWTNISLISRLDLYLNYAAPKYIIMRWDTMLNMKINKWLSTNLSVSMIYDHNAIAALQVKQILGVGFQASF